MELNNLEDTKASHHSLKMEEQQREEGDDVTLVLSLPGGRIEEKKLKIGVTVAYVSAEHSNDRQRWSTATAKKPTCHAIARRQS